MIQHQTDRIAELEAERDALKAQVVQLRSALQEIASVVPGAMQLDGSTIRVVDLEDFQDIQRVARKLCQSQAR